ncbi:indole-3-glycerol-phosphate synthase [Deferribacter autotrophicus]|uniref:Indole-3-glycerol phosphate synthase n=1 Tax=Deferribacter autotrophicus TaxID=500465 RepID=A0A5A8F0A7_9BACT|nr:indole-3-glycerol phosphate synthase TrpC [Deferribacter autotrophicus]KAA0257093.1 indole-3-glycerol-phosphate synthase [Deferribacter autotrophicus]
MFLKKIYELKKAEVKELKKGTEKRVKEVIPFERFLPDRRIIAEVKQASPSLGEIKKVDVKRQAELYEKGGAAAISVLTDKNYFNGDFKFLKEISSAVNLPILCKDFIVDEVQIDLAYEYGADVILLIASMLEGDELKKLFDYSKKLGLEVLVEIHEYEELYKLKDLDVKFLGVNSRDLTTLKVNKEKALKTMSKIKGNYIKIAESGIETKEDIKRFKEAGADMFLVGTSLMKSDNPVELLKELSEGYSCL